MHCTLYSNANQLVIIHNGVENDIVKQYVMFVKNILGTIAAEEKLKMKFEVYKALEYQSWVVDGINYHE